MSEVRYSINGQYFRDFGVYVSDSKGIADTLKRKKVNSYDWAEYHGISVDLGKPKYEAREIELKCFILGDNWEELFSNFNKMIRDEFAKEGTQRLLIEPFGFKALPYEVFLQDEVKVDKTFREGKMAATFSLKMIEPNPIKKVLYFTGNTLDLAFKCPYETEIFYGNGLKETAQGNVSLSGKTLANRVVSGYAFEGRNLLLNTGSKNWISHGSDTGGVTVVNIDKGAKLTHLDTGNAYWILNKVETFNNTNYVLSFEYKTLSSATLYYYYDKGNLIISLEPSLEWKKFEFKYTKTTINATKILFGFMFNKSFEFKNVKLEKGNKATDWTPAPEDEKYIIIAGNVEEITNLITNADVLWERL